MNLVTLIAERIMEAGQKRASGKVLIIDALSIEQTIYTAMVEYSKHQEAQPSTPELRKSLHSS